MATPRGLGAAEQKVLGLIDAEELAELALRLSATATPRWSRSRGADG